MADELDEVVALTLKRRPWMIADEWSIWRVSGEYSNDSGTFHDCLAIALPHFATGGHVVFQMLPPLNDVITPENIAHGVEYELVRKSNDSGTAPRTGDAHDTQHDGNLER